MGTPLEAVAGNSVAGGQGEEAQAYRKYDDIEHPGSLLMIPGGPAARGCENGFPTSDFRAGALLRRNG